MPLGKTLELIISRSPLLRADTAPVLTEQVDAMGVGDDEGARGVAFFQNLGRSRDSGRRGRWSYSR